MITNLLPVEACLSNSFVLIREYSWLILLS